MLSVTSDYATSTGSPEPALRRIAAAGFTHVHWCHQWCTDFLYSASETAQIGRWLAEFGLRLCDVHASHGKEKGWCSPAEYERQAGLELVRNRIRFAAELGGDVVIIHLPAVPENPADDPGFSARLHDSIESLFPELAACGVRLAFENMIRDNFTHIGSLLAEYPADRVGLCYDSGHGNMNPGALASLDALRERLIAVHLHDNDGQSDQHQPPFFGTVDWPALAGILAASSYRKPLSFEVAIRATGIADEGEFLALAYERAEKVAELVALAGDSRA
ncbi:MAG: sugar phosphate isomerase/epimerase family protein [Lentisphaeria bacterium]|jgi:sugar phosphate isomerase/epimerase|nr:sugar phosphate isomerase/epimerase family protein [Lentisphaeria bacterium]